MKKFLLFIWLLVTCSVFYACSSGESGGSSSSTSNNTSTTVNKKTSYLLDSTKKTYTNYSIEEIDKMFSENSYRTKQLFDDRLIGLVGVISSISSDGKEIIVKSSETEWTIKCVNKNSDAKEEVKKISVGDRTVVCGEVDDSERDEFKVSFEKIVKVNKDEDCKGFTDAVGNVCTSAEWTEENIGQLYYFYSNKWSRTSSDIFESGYEYNLGNDESVKVFYVDYKVVKRQAENQNNDGEEWWSIKEKGEVEDYLTYRLSLERMEYKTDSEKINGRKFDYYGGIAEKKASGQKNELYYGKVGDDYMIIVAYLYKGDPQHYDEVATLMSTIRVE